MGVIEIVATESVCVVIYLFVNSCDNPDYGRLINMQPGSYSFSRLRATIAPLLSAHVEFTRHQIRAAQWYVLPMPPTFCMNPVLKNEGKFCIMDECERDVDGSKCIVVDLRGCE